MNLSEENKKTLEVLAERLYGIMEVNVKDLWKKQDQDFLKNIANDVAREKVLAEIDSENSDQHLRNIEHLAATLQGEVIRQGLRIRVMKKDLFIQLITTVIRTVSIPLLKAAIKK